MRWLSSTFMTGITSVSLMGVAIFVALEGKEILAPPAVFSASGDYTIPISNEPGQKAIRIQTSIKNNREPDKLIMNVPTLVKSGNQQIVRSRPFAFVAMPLASNYNISIEYPEFNPLTIFSSDNPNPATSQNSGEIYGANIDSEITLHTINFPIDNRDYQYDISAISLHKAEQAVRTNGSIILGKDSQTTTLHYVDPRRFGQQTIPIFDVTSGLNARVIAENISITAYTSAKSEKIDFYEDIRPIRINTGLGSVLSSAGYDKEQILIYEDLLSDELDVFDLEPGMSLRIGVEQSGDDQPRDETQIVRLSVYQQKDHLVTAAQNDHGHYILTDEPIYSPNLAAILEDSPDIIPRLNEMPTVYDAIYQASLSYGMTPDMTKQLIGILASSIDFRAKIKPDDKIETFFSISEDQNIATENSELLYISANFGENISRFYRFIHPEDKSVDYYNQDGLSARQFLLRNPVPTGKFRSAFGMRRHPITGRRRMHSGVDWSAPRGTPILAAGDGVVEFAGWHSGGYGRQTKIRHANGYVSSYSHQSKISRGIVPGVHVKQGQIIGQIGSTGLSTGPHLHYELIVNDTKVDPLRVRLPKGKVLKGEALAQFQREQKKLNTLLDIKDEPTELAHN